MTPRDDKFFCRFGSLMEESRVVSGTVCHPGVIPNHLPCLPTSVWAGVRGRRLTPTEDGRNGYVQY